MPLVLPLYGHMESKYTSLTVEEWYDTGGGNKSPLTLRIFAFKVPGEGVDEEKGDEEEEKTSAMPRKAGCPIINKK